MTLREQLCVSLYATIKIQDSSEDAIASRSTTLVSLLKDISQLTNFAAGNCTLALLETINLGAKFLAKGDLPNQVTEALSGVVGLNLTQEIMNNVTIGVRVLTDAVQGSIALGEPQNNFNTKNARIGIALVDPSSMSGSSFKPPLTASEEFNNKESNSFTVSESSVADAMGVSVFQFNNNPGGGAVDSTPIGIKLNTYITDTASRRRRSRRSLSSAATNSEMTIVLRNTIPNFSYYNISNQVDLAVNCDDKTSVLDYNVTVNCPFGNTTLGPAYPVSIYNESYAFTCSAGISNNITYSCPASSYSPICASFDGANYVDDPACTVVSFTAWNTTCLCASSTSRRRLSLGEGDYYDTYTGGDIDIDIDADTEYGGLLQYRDRSLPEQARTRARALAGADDAAEGELKQFSNMGGVIANGFIQNVGSAEALAEDPLAVISANLVVFVVMATILSMTIGGLLLTAWRDDHGVKAYFETIKEKHTKMNIKMKSRDVKEFLNDALPDEFTGQPWPARYWKKLVDEHDLLAAFMPYHADRGYTWMRFTLVMCTAINMLFIDTVLAGLFFADDGTCESHLTEDTCMFQRSLDQTGTMCMWEWEDSSAYLIALGTNGATMPDGSPTESSFGECAFNESSEDFIPTLILTIIITILTVPLDAMVEMLVGHVAGLFQHSPDKEIEEMLTPDENVMRALKIRQKNEEKLLHALVEERGIGEEDDKSYFSKLINGNSWRERRDAHFNDEYVFGVERSGGGFDFSKLDPKFEDHKYVISED